MRESLKLKNTENGKPKIAINGCPVVAVRKADD